MVSVSTSAKSKFSPIKPLINFEKYMNLTDLYGPTLTLRELCNLLKISRSSYYAYSNKSNHLYKEGFPSSIPGYDKKRFVTDAVEKYLISFAILV